VRGGFLFFFFAFESAVAPLPRAGRGLRHVRLEYCCLEENPRALGAREVLLEDLSRLRSYSVREADFELHDQVSSLAGGLGEGQPLPAQSLHGPRLDDVVAGQRDHPPVDGGNVHGAAAQGLREEEGDAPSDGAGTPKHPDRRTPSPQRPAPPVKPPGSARTMPRSIG